MWLKFALVAGLSIVPLTAFAADGLYAGTLDCSAVGTSPAFAQSVTLAIRDGQGSWSSGRAGVDGFHTTEIKVEPDGSINVRGYYLIGSENRPTELSGRMDGRVVHARGKRGPRDCTLSLVRPPPSNARPPYRMPYGPDAVRTREVKPPQPRPCPDASTPPHDLRPEPFYRRDDPTHSIVDPERLSAYTAILKPLREFEAATSTQADLAMRISGSPNRAATCIVDALDSWAKAGALLGETTRKERTSESGVRSPTRSLTWILGPQRTTTKRSG